MPGAHFNPPPNWPVDRGWTPTPDWQPDPSWPPAPPGWHFWIEAQPQPDEPVEHTSPSEPDANQSVATEPEAERPWAPQPAVDESGAPSRTESAEEPWAPRAERDPEQTWSTQSESSVPAQPWAPSREPAVVRPWVEPPAWTGAEPPPAVEPPPRRHTGIIAGAAALAVALVAGTVGVVAWWNDDSTTPARPERMLPGTYPTQPQPAWNVRASALVSGGDPSIATPVYAAAYYGSPGAVVVGDHVLFHATAEQSNGTGAQLVSLNLSDGHVEWSAPAGISDGCSLTLLGDTLPCTKSGDSDDVVQFIDMKSGGTVSTAQVPFHLAMLATDGEQLYTAGYDNPAGLTVASGTREDPVADWKTTIAESQCSGYGGGDGMDIHVGDGLVWGYQGGGANFVLRASDGAPVLEHEVTDASVVDGPTVVAQRCQQGVDPPDWPSAVADGQGRPLFTSSTYLRRHELNVATGGQPPFLTDAGDGLDPVTGNKLWHLRWPGGAPEGAHPTLVVGNVLIVGGDGATAYDMRSGAELWHAATDEYLDGAVTDGPNLLAVNGRGGIDAISIADGSLVWSSAMGFDENERPRLYATDRGLLVVNRQGITLLPPTGPAAPIPNVNGPESKSDNDGGTKLVTKCGRPPEFVPQTIRADSGALVITVKIVAHCPGGDVLSSAQTRLAVTSNGQNVAAAVFDLSAKPIVIAPGSGGSSDSPTVSHDFSFPAGTFWRLPVSTHEAPTNGSTSEGAVDLDASTLVIDCQQDGPTASNQQSGNSGAGSGSSTATGPGRPGSGDDESSSYDALRAIANSDRPFVTGRLADRWVPQLSSKRPGLVADGITWHNAETLREHLDLRLKYPEVRLLWTGDWSTFSAPDFWVTIAGVTFPDAAGALAWCTGHNFDREHCYAKLVSTTHPIDGSTAFNK